MNKDKSFSSVQTIALVTLRILIGWHILFEGISKLLNPNWSSTGFLKESQWILEGFSHWILSNPSILNIVDILNIWGLIAIGLGLMLGAFTNIAAISGVLLLFIYYLCNPPLIGLSYSMPTEGSYLLVNKTLIEAIAMIIIALFPTSHVFGIDLYLKNIKAGKTTKNRQKNGDREN